MRQKDRSALSVDRDRLWETLQPYSIRLAVLFGSHATNTAHRFSDLDIAIEFETSVSNARRRELLDEIAGQLI
jgi:predicted nucleotidyltransferase